MAEPAAIWSPILIVFDTALSNTQNIILAQGRQALVTLVQHIDQVHELLTSSPVLDTSVDPRLGPLLSDLCNQQAVASTILFDDIERTKENAAAKALRAERVAYVKLHSRGQNITVLNNKKVRNSLAHIDEYLASALRRQNTGWFIDVAIARRDQFVAPNGILIGFCRCYIASEDVLLHLDNEISLSDLRREAVALLLSVFDHKA